MEEKKKITFDDLQKANETIKTTDIKGKDYAEVNQRIKAFKMVYPEGSILTELVSDENGVCKFKATVYNEEGKVLATGTAYERENSTFINKTSYIENCETSAVGRALGLAGFGIDTSIASAEEVTNAINNQNKKETKVDYKKELEKLLDEQGIDKATFCRAKKLSVRSSQERFKVEYELLKNEIEATETATIGEILTMAK